VTLPRLLSNASIDTLVPALAPVSRIPSLTLVLAVRSTTRTSAGVTTIAVVDCAAESASLLTAFGRSAAGVCTLVLLVHPIPRVTV